MLNFCRRPRVASKTLGIDDDWWCHYFLPWRGFFVKRKILFWKEGFTRPMKNVDISAVFWVLILPMRNWNIGCFLFERKLQMVLILPMRNWNLLTSSTHCVPSQVLILPMRNWNLPSRAGSVPGKWFWSYLWGIETNMHITFGLQFPSFDLTYEELKQILARNNWHLLSQFWSYLWGIETSPLR